MANRQFYLKHKAAPQDEQLFLKSGKVRIMEKGGVYSVYVDGVAGAFKTTREQSAAIRMIPELNEFYA